MTAVRPARSRRHRCLAAAALALITSLAGAQASDGSTPPDTGACATLWQVTPVLDGAGGEPAHLQVALRFQGGARQQTALHLPGGWAALVESSPPRLRPVTGEAAWRSVAHAPGETVQLQWRLQPGAAMLSPGWFAFSGLAVLPLPEGADAPDAGPACVLLQGLPAGAGAAPRWASSHGIVEGPGALWRLGAAGVPLAQRVQQSLYAGGALQVQAAPGLLAVMPQPSPWPIDAATLAEAGTQALAAQQRQWLPAGKAASANAGTTPVASETATTPPWLLLALPAPAADTSLADASLVGALHQALALQLPTGWAGDSPALQRLLAPALARAWLADRFGPLAHTGRGDGALRAWFSEGWADFLAHRALLRDGLWSPEDFAAAMNTRAAAYLADPSRSLPNVELAAGSMQSPALARLQAMRGEWLAFHWHQALRQAGQPGLDAALRLQLVNPAQARREGPLSMPLATHRMLATLRSVLQDQPLRDLQQHIDQGRPFELGPDSLGPCFTASPTAPGTAPVWRPVPGALQQADCQGWLGLGLRTDMQLGRVPRLAPVAGIASAPGDCELVPVRAKRSKAGKAARAGARQVLRCRPADAAPAGSRATATAKAKAGSTSAAAATGKAKATGKTRSAAKTKASSKAAGKGAAKPAKPRTTKAQR